MESVREENHMAGPVVSMDLRVGTQDLGPHWMAWEVNFGLMAFADDEEAAATRLIKVVDMTLSLFDDGTQAGLENLLKYIENHKVGYAIEDAASIIAVPPQVNVGVSRNPEAVLVAAR